MANIIWEVTQELCSHIMRFNLINLSFTPSKMLTKNNFLYKMKGVLIASWRSLITNDSIKYKILDAHELTTQMTLELIWDQDYWKTRYPIQNAEKE